VADSVALQVPVPPSSFDPVSSPDPLPLLPGLVGFVGFVGFVGLVGLVGLVEVPWVLGPRSRKGTRNAPSPAIMSAVAASLRLDGMFIFYFSSICRPEPVEYIIQRLEHA